MPYRSVTVRGIALLCFPPGDRAFFELARSLVEDLPEAEDPDPAALEGALRRIYPDAIVRGQSSLATYTAPGWYLYRDGRYSPFGEDGPWWERPGCPRVVIGPDGRYLDGSPEALALLNVSLEELRGSRIGDFTTAGQQERIPWLRALLDDVGEVHSTATLRPRGGLPDRPVEYHMRLAPSGDGTIISSMRPVPAAAVALPEAGDRPLADQPV